MSELNFPINFLWTPCRKPQNMYNFDFKFVSVEKSFLRQGMTSDESDKLHTIRKRQQPARGLKI